LADDPAGPGKEHARLAEQVERDVGDRRLFLKLWQAGHPLLQAVAVDQRVVPEGEAEARERLRVELSGDGRIDPFPRVGDPGAERPAVTLVVVFRKQVVRAVVVRVRIKAAWIAGVHVSDALTCAGRRRGCRRTSDGGTPCHLTA